MTARGVAIGVVVALLALAGSFSAGRFSAPAVIATAVQLQAVRVEVVHEVEKKVYLRAKAQLVTTDKTTDPKTGLVTEHSVTKTDTTVSLNDDKNRAATLNDSSSSLSTKTVTNLPRWRLSLQVGASWPKPLLPIAGPLVLGASGEYRILGGWSAGVWLNTYGAAGVVTSLEF